MAYLAFHARPVGFTADAASLRALSLDQVIAGQWVQLTAAGALRFCFVRWDPDEVAADDGVRYFIPDSISFPDPGRWVMLGSHVSMPDTYVLRDAAGLAEVALAAPLTLSEETAAANTAPDFLIFQHTVDPGSGAAGLGASVLSQAENDAGALVDALRLTNSLVSAVAGAESSKLDVYLRNAGALALKASFDNAGNFAAIGNLFSASKVDALMAVPYTLGGNASALAFDATSGAATWKKAGLSARADVFDSAGANSSTYVAGATSVSEAWTARSSIGAGGAWTRTGQQGTAGNPGGKLAFVTGLGGTPGTDLSGSFDVDLGQTSSDATAYFRLLSSGTPFFGLRTISGQLLSYEAPGGASAGGISFATVGLVQTLLPNDQVAIWQWTTTQFTRWRRKVVQTTNATPDTSVTFLIPSSASGTVEILVTAVDKTNGNRATYRRLYTFSRRSAAASVFAAAGADVVYEDAAAVAWDALATHASPTITLSLTGDAVNAVQFDAQWRIDYQTFTPV